MNKNKLNFFSRVKLAIVNLEDYNLFINEKLFIGIKYFFLIVLIFANILTILETYDFSRKMSKGYKYVKSEMPNFQYSNGNLEFSQDVNSYDSEFDFRFITETSKEWSNDNIFEVTDKITTQGLILFKDKAVFINNGSRMILDYVQLQEDYGISDINKEILLEKIDAIGVGGIAVIYFCVILLGLFVFESISLFMDWFVLSIFAYCATKITKTDLNFKQTFNISIYSLTLSIFLYMIYCIANYVFDFYTQYFKTIYLLIAYVYVVAVILMIKSDMMKQKVEIGKIEDIKKENLEETYHEEDNEKENCDKEKNKDDDKKANDENEEGDIVDGEPDGSEI